jgi:hydrogenase maturation protease
MLHSLRQREIQVRRIKVIGIGSALRKDDSIGLRLADSISVEEIDQSESSCDLSLLYALEGYDTAVIIDAVDFGGKAGETRIMRAEDLPKNPNETHSMDLGFILGIMNLLESSPDVFVFGVQPADLGFGDSLSEALSMALPGIKRRLEEFVKSLM